MKMGSTVCNLYYPSTEFSVATFQQLETGNWKLETIFGHPVDTDPLITTTAVIHDWPIRRQKQ
jgi:hypothetical protein